MGGPALTALLPLGLIWLMAAVRRASTAQKYRNIPSQLPAHSIAKEAHTDLYVR